MINVIITGAAGKMGRMNVKVVSDNRNSQVIGAVDVPGSPAIGMDAGELAGIGKLDVGIVDDINKIAEGCDVIIDFSSPMAIEKNLAYAVSHNVAIVIGTTGVNAEMLSKIKAAGEKIPAIWAPNYSIGVNLIAKLTEMAATILHKDFDVEIVEAHHRMKKDAPSGTAIKLLDVVKKAYHTEDVVYGREGISGERPEKQIGVHAVRGGDVVGDHTVGFYGIGERVEITHKASTRETFSRGALRAAEYILEKGIGFYTMEDVLGF